MPPGHGTGCFFAPPRKSVHKLVHILGAPKKHSQIPEVALVDFTPQSAPMIMVNGCELGDSNCSKKKQTPFIN